ncbi:MAG: uncharacterized protein QOG54_1944 [Actinomycetota bacterium]|jgi:uncharacterized protein (TIGR00251 family)|nr:uncharacterized protein [Actinomycetota bacterium]
MEPAGYITESGGRVFLDVFVQPRARVEGIVGIQGRALKMKVKAPPLDGRANDAVVRSIAEALGIAPRQVVIVRGESSRNKRLEIAGLTLPEVRSALTRVVSSHAHEPG